MNNVPMLGSSISLMMNCLMYSTENRHTEYYFLLYDENKKHYNCITDISAFLGVREFCFNCLKGFHLKKDFECHECAKIIEKKTTNPKHQGKMLKELGHF